MADEPTRTMLRRASTDARTDDSRAMGLPDDLLKQSVVRLRALALVYAFVFFFQDILGWLIVPGDEINSLDDWLPATLSITVALLVAWSTTRPSLHPKTVLRFGLAFEILGSFGIAIAEYWNVYEGLEYQPQHLDIAGLSWVAPWVMLYTVAVPARPRTALLASAASVAMVPLVLLLTMRFGGTSIVLTPSEFFTGLIFPSS